MRKASKIQAAALLVASADATSETPAPVATPTKADETAAVRAAIAERISGARAVAAVLYNGPSLAIHGANRNPKLQACIDRVAAPIQRAASATVRDLSALAAAKAHLIGETDTFEPNTYGADLGTLSRIASLGLIATDGTAIFVTALGKSTKTA